MTASGRLVLAMPLASVLAGDGGNPDYRGQQKNQDTGHTNNTQERQRTNREHTHTTHNQDTEGTENKQQTEIYD